MAKILHAADFHIGAGFEFLPEEKAEQAKKIQINQLSYLINRANDTGVDAVLIAGDLFDTPTASLSLASDVFSIISKCLCPVFLSPGNHDYYFSKSPYSTKTLPPNLHVFSERTLTPYKLKDNETVIWGAAFQDMKASIDLNAAIDESNINICVLHGEINGDKGYNPLTAEDVAESGFDYIALGHNHTYSGLQKSGSTFYSCSGCFSPAVIKETGEKGYLSVDISKNGVNAVFSTSRAIEFLEIVLPMDNIKTDEQLEEELKQHIPSYHNRVCCTLRLVGEKNYSADIDSLSSALKQVFFHSFLRDETEEPIDLWQYINDDDIKGEVTRSFKQKIDNSSKAEEKDKYLLALKYALWALDGQAPNI